MISYVMKKYFTQLVLILAINLRPPSIITAQQSNNSENGLFPPGRLRVTSHVKTPKNQKKKIADRKGPRVPRNGIQSLGAGIGEEGNEAITMKTATNTPINASPAIKPAESKVPLLTSSLPDLMAVSDGWPARVPSTRKWVVRVTRWLSIPPMKIVADR